MYYKWAKDEEDRKVVAGEISDAKPFIKRLVEMLGKEYKTLDEQRLSRDIYDKSSWPYYQADKIGEQRGVKKIIKLLNNAINGETK